MAGSLNLGREIESLGRALRADLPEATAFHAGRLLEAMAADATARAGLPGSDASFEALMQLDRFQFLDRAVRIWAHGLRRLGNEARHVLRPLDRVDGVLAALLAERWLDWFLRRFEFGPRLTELTLDHASLRIVDDEPLRSAFADVEKDLVEAKPRARPEDPAIISGTPILACALGEALLDAKEFDRAGKLLGRALQHFPEHVRLRQLEATRLSRLGHFDEAISQVQLPGGRKIQSDPEASGILGGIYKRMWRRGLERKDLEQSLATYATAWKNFRKTNVYLGINVAATALWLGKEKESRETAAACRALLEAQVEGLREKLGDRAPGLGPWDRASIAEAYLLEGRHDEADRAYRALLDDPNRPEGVVAVARDQASFHYRHLGRGADFDRVFGAGFVVGVTGHRTMADEPGVSQAVRGLIARLLAEAGAGRRLVVLSALAEGADRLVARLAMRAPFGAELRVLLPMPPAEYSKSFGDDSSRKEFADLLERASTVEIVPAPPGDDSPEAAYEMCGRAIADRSQALLALWDGGPSKGRGGTADIVQYARDRGVRLEVVPTRRI